jgi:hypothetical protein
LPLHIILIQKHIIAIKKKKEQKVSPSLKDDEKVQVSQIEEEHVRLDVQ